MNYFSKNIRILRIKHGYKQADMLDNIGIARTTWSSYENGVSQPDIDGILKIAAFFDIQVSTLLDKDLHQSDTAAIEKENENQNTNYKSGNTAEEIGVQSLQMDQLISEVLQAKQQVIELQAETIRTLQALIESQLAELKPNNSQASPDNQELQNEGYNPV